MLRSLRNAKYRHQIIVAKTAWHAATAPWGDTGEDGCHCLGLQDHNWQKTPENSD